MSIEIADDNDQDLNEVKPSRVAGVFGVLEHRSETKVDDDLHIDFLQWCRANDTTPAKFHRNNMTLAVYGKTWDEREAEEERKQAEEKLHAAHVAGRGWVDKAVFIAPQQNAGLRAVAGASA